MSRVRTSPNGFRIPSVLASIALHAAGLLVIGVWMIEPSTPATPYIAYGNGGVEVRLQVKPSRPAAPEVESILEPQLSPLVVSPTVVLGLAGQPELEPLAPPENPPPPILAAALVAAPSTVAPSHPPASDAPDAEELALPPRPEDPGLPGRQGVQSGNAPGGGIRVKYPASCERLRHEGTASIECEVDASGLVISARVIRSAGCEHLDHAALEAVRAARFRPATEGGVRVASRVVQPVNFVLPAAR